MNWRRLLPRLFIAALIIAAIACFFVFDLSQYLSLHALKDQQQSLQAWHGEHPWLLAAGFLVGLSRGADYRAAARLGGLVAAEVIQHFGARPETPLKALAQDNGFDL